jgi:hypothetical protein
MAIPGIVLAAGASHRFGQNKLLIPLGGHAVLYHALQAALTAPLDPVILVIGYESDKALQALEELRGSPKLRVLKNSHWAQGRAESLKLGLAAVLTLTPVPSPLGGRGGDRGEGDNARARPRCSSAPGRYAARDPSADRTSRPSFSTRAHTVLSHLSRASRSPGGDPPRALWGICAALWRCQRIAHPAKILGESYQARARSRRRANPMGYRYSRGSRTDA